MRFGVFYYPEQWPRDEWKRDLDNIARLGFDFTHVGKFAWTELEPAEGRFDFAWLDEVLALAATARLEVVLSTPSLCPPAWMGEKHPEIYLVGADGRRREHGNRANASLTNPVYLASLDRIVEELARRYGRDPRVLGWQIDNEPLATPDYSPSSRAAFQSWLAARYGTIDRLNEAWGGAFWSLRAEATPGAPLPPGLRARRTALLWSHDVMWDLENHKETTRWGTWRHRTVFTAAVKSTAAPMDFVSERDDFTAYPFVVAPAYQLVVEAFVRKWRLYAEGGGHLVLTCRTGQKDARGQLPEGPWAGSIASLIGARVTAFDTLPEGVAGTVRSGGRTHAWSMWADLLEPEPGTEVLATYADQFYAGKAAAVTRRLGKGSVTYVGVETATGELERELVRDVYRRAGVATEDLPRGAYLEWRDGLRVGVNYGNEPVSFPVPSSARVLLGTNPLPPAQVLVWKE